MDGADPVGNRWNYDEDNREPPPKKQRTLELPKPYQPREDDIDDEVRRDLDGMALDTVGVDGPRLFAVTPAEAKRALDRFIEHRLPAFGRYEDAIMGEDWAMSHSLLSVPLNLGVLHPLDAVEAAEAGLPPRGRSTGRRRGLHPADPRLARVHVAPLLALRPATTPREQHPRRHDAAARLVGQPRLRRRHRRMPSRTRSRASATAAGATTSSA